MYFLKKLTYESEGYKTYVRESEHFYTMHQVEIRNDSILKNKTYFNIEPARTWFGTPAPAGFRRYEVSFSAERNEFGGNVSNFSKEIFGFFSVELILQRAHGGQSLGRAKGIFATLNDIAHDRVTKALSKLPVESKQGNGVLRAILNDDSQLFSFFTD